MIRATRNWFRRNRTNFAVGFGVLGAGYVATQYVLSKLADAREQMSSDRTARENLRRRFEQNQEDCTFTVLALLPTATENVLGAIPVESITHELQQKKAERLARSGGSTEPTSSEWSSASPSVAEDDGRSLRSFQSEGYVHASQMAGSAAGIGESTAKVSRPRKSKAQLWNDVKINAITRSFTLIYTLSLLTLLTRIQLNLLGRRNYLTSVISLASPATAESTISLEDHDADTGNQAYGDDFETNRRYLTFSWWLLHRGWRDVMRKVEAAVREVFGPLNPRDDVAMDKMSELTLEVRRKIEGATDAERRSHKWLSYLLPPPSEEAFVLRESGVAPSSSPSLSPPSEQTTALLRRLLDETADLIDSPTFSNLTTRLLDSGFTLLIDSKLATQAFRPTPSPSSHPADAPPTTTPAPTTSTSLLNPVQIPLRPTDGFPSAAVLPPLDARIEEHPQSPSPSPPLPAQTRTKLATVLAVLTRQAHAIGSGVPNEYLQAMDGVKELDAFAAVVYSSNFDIDAQRDDDGNKAESSSNSSNNSKDNSEQSTSQNDEPRSDPALAQSTLEPASAESGFESAWGKAVFSTSSASSSPPSGKIRGDAPGPGAGAV